MQGEGKKLGAACESPALRTTYCLYAFTRRLLARIETSARSRAAHLQIADRKVRHSRENISAQFRGDRGRWRAAQHRAQYHRVPRFRAARERTVRAAEHRRAS